MSRAHQIYFRWGVEYGKYVYTNCLEYCIHTCCQTLQTFIGGGVQISVV